MSLSQDSIPPDHNDHHADSPEEVAVALPEQQQPKREEQVLSSASSSLAEQLPPEAQGEANGGPLGCCLGVMIGLLLSLSIALISRFYAESLAQVFGGALSLIVRITMISVAIIAVVVCSMLGWKIGKKLYREYDPPFVKERKRCNRK